MRQGRRRSSETTPPSARESSEAPVQTSNADRAARLPAVAEGAGRAPGASSEWAAAGEVEAQHGSGDHDIIGGEEVVAVGPHSVTTGELNELVDYVLSLDELAALAPAQLARGLELIGTMEEGGLSAEESDEFDAIFPNYAAIALDNSDHFAPRSGDLAPAGSANFLGQIRQHFGEAHALAESGDLNGALACAGWGGHYVADAFSAGHLFNKDEIMFEADTHLRLFGPHLVFGQAAEAIVLDSVVAGWGVRTLFGERDLTAGDIAAMLHAANVFQHAAVSGAIAKAIHDRLAGSGGSRVVEVECSGRTWLLGGDGDLDPIAQELAGALVHHAYEDLRTLSEEPGSISSGDFLAELEAGLPTPTADGQARIDQIIAEVFSSTEALSAALAEAAIHEFDTILANFQGMPGLGLLLVRRESDAPDHEDGHEETHPEQSYGGLDWELPLPRPTYGDLDWTLPERSEGPAAPAPETASDDLLSDLDGFLAEVSGDSAYGGMASAPMR